MERKVTVHRNGDGRRRKAVRGATPFRPLPSSPACHPAAHPVRAQEGAEALECGECGRPLAAFGKTAVGVA